MDRHVRVCHHLAIYSELQTKGRENSYLKFRGLFKGTACINYMNYEGPVLHIHELFQILFKELMELHCLFCCLGFFNDMSYHIYNIFSNICYI